MYSVIATQYNRAVLPAEFVHKNLQVRLIIDTIGSVQLLSAFQGNQKTSAIFSILREIHLPIVVLYLNRNELRWADREINSSTPFTGIKRMKAESLKVMCSVDGRIVISDLPPPVARN